MLVIALVAIAGCSSDDDNFVPETFYDAVAGHWYTELPISGETDNWRSAEVGDRTTFDKVTVLFYLGDSVMKDGWWGYLYLKEDNELVNYGGIDLGKSENRFNYNMTADGHITPSNHIEYLPQITNMLYDSRKDNITADVIYNGQSYHLSFIRPGGDVWERLNEYYEILLKAGVVGGNEDGYGHLATDVSNADATELPR